MKLITALEPLPSLARTSSQDSGSIRVGVVQQAWHSDPVAHESALREGIELAAGSGAELVCLQELTLSPYFASDPAGATDAGVKAEALPGGPTFEFARRAAADFGVHVHASLYEENPGTELGYNTAIVVSPEGELVARTRKLHIPITAGYFEDRYFEGGPSDSPYPVVDLLDAKLGFPTCWDQWFPEVARAYSLAGTQVVVYPTAIGSEPDHPDFDTEPLWERVIIANGINSGLFMVTANRIGTEGDLTFYGSSFISDPYGRKLVQAPRDEAAVLVAELDLGQRDDWLELFPFLGTRRPDTYESLTRP